MDYIDSISGEDKFVNSALKSLNEEIISAINKDPSVPFENDNEYINYVEQHLQVINLRKNLESSLQLKASDVMIESEYPQFQSATFLLSAYKKLADHLEEIAKKKVEATAPEKRPRVIRVVERLKLSPVEQKAFVFLLVSSLNNYSNVVITNAPALMYFTGMTWEQVSNFISPQREHIKQNMFEYIDADRPFATSIIFTPEMQLALIGVQLSDEKMLKIDNTSVSEVINEELPEDLRRSMNLSKEENDTSMKPSSDDDQDFEIVETSPKTSLNNEQDNLNEDLKKVDFTDPMVEDSDVPPSNKDESSAVDLDAEPEDFHDFLKREIESEKKSAPPKSTSGGDATAEDSDKIVPYTSDLDYLETTCKLFVVMFQIEQMERQKRETRAYSYGSRGDDYAQEMRIRELKAQSRVLQKKCEKRLELTKEAGEWLPRVERMATVRNFDAFEKKLILALIGTHISAELQTLGHHRGISVGNALRAFCTSFEDQINHRHYFYKGSRLIKEGIVRISGGTALDSDLMDAHLTIDRRMLEFAMGLDTEFSELVEGSHLYFPSVQLDHVVLPEDTKKLILTTVSNFEGFKRARKRMKLDDAISYGSGIVMLFFGASGTGKTMMANSIANHMKKKILLINFPSLGRMSGGENLKFIFREARINDAILFFDECESIFESREKGNYEVNLLLTEIERHDGLIIMATNRAYDLDEAMHRRVTLAIEFRKPDPLLREQIWKANIPAELKLSSDVNLKDLALNFELTGGFIKNAILSALSMAVSRDGEKEATIRQEDLENGARLQLRGRLRMIDFDHRVVPTRGLDSLVLPDSRIHILKEIVSYEKARQVLFGQWGFERVIGQDKANSVLFWGPPGTGKTLAAEAIAFSTGKPLKLINTGELLSKWVGDTPKNINAVFEEAAAHDAVLVFDEADSLFGSRTTVTSATDRYANLDVGLLLYHIEHYHGVIILCTNLVKDIDPAFFRRIKFVVEFTIPDGKERATLWRKLIPPECPVDKNVDFARLGTKFGFAGGNIKSAIIRAATRAALRENKRFVTMEDLEVAADEEQKKGEHLPTGTSLYS